MNQCFNTIFVANIVLDATCNAEFNVQGRNRWDALEKVHPLAASTLTCFESMSRSWPGGAAKWQ
jgi:hypothetical protein